jgi:hypothetical protein
VQLLHNSTRNRGIERLQRQKHPLRPIGRRQFLSAHGPRGSSHVSRGQTGWREHASLLVTGEFIR